ncbi:hypothetical protein [Polaribacter porphyrae]|uniref:Uncharacterized protein n=1 Tax=Polaribacter porphyrae TaxID=1137780 RepID=A0A2S7WQG9_9FLAO|nr:hypothetical protein [Polaribacter porphyrae]PQJ79686.1 hypothetical protein BTO18_11100 [Polaribacter porphyrae]
MKIKYQILLLTLLFSFSFSAQKKNTHQSKKITSIYTFSSFSNNANSFTNFNKKLKLNNLRFVYLNQDGLDLNLFSFNFRDIGVTPSKFIYDDYISYRDEYLLKGWIRKHDPTHWNLQCPNPLNIQPTQ